LGRVPPADEPDDVDSHLLASDLEALARDPQSRARICAWCAAVCIEGAWHHAELISRAWPVDFSRLALAHHLSRLFCPRGAGRAVPELTTAPPTTNR
jgi:hypothetical protein